MVPRPEPQQERKSPEPLRHRSSSTQRRPRIIPSTRARTGGRAAIRTNPPLTPAAAARTTMNEALPHRESVPPTGSA
jgi:hypothetical protein